MKQSRRLTQILKRMILNSVSAGSALLSMLGAWLAWPVYIIGVVLLSLWQWHDHKTDKRSYKWCAYDSIWPYVIWVLAMGAFSALYWIIQYRLRHPYA